MVQRHNIYAHTERLKSFLHQEFNPQVFLIVLYIKFSNQIETNTTVILGISCKYSGTMPKSCTQH